VHTTAEARCIVTGHTEAKRVEALHCVRRATPNHVRVVRLFERRVAEWLRA
jgi:hypothetical protein